MNERNSPARDAGIDLVKTAAIACVLCLHASTAGLAAPAGSFGWWCAVFWTSAVRAGVPLFFLCSGALLLSPARELPLRRLWGRNILRIVLAMLVWAIFYKVCRLLAGGTFSVPALWQAVKEVLVFKQEFHLYYLHILLLVYALLPLTRAFVRAASETELRYALALWFALGIVFPTLRAYWPFTLLTDIPLQWMLNMSWAAVGYGLLGWYLTRRPLRPAVAWPLALAGFALVFVPTALCSLRAGALEERFLEGMSVGVCLLAAGLFSLLYPAGRDMKPGKGRAFVTAVSRASFCIFLVHVLWLEVFAYFGLTAAAFTPIISIPLLAALNAALSFLCWWLLAKVPFVRRWLI